nr:hypothetical protein [Tanacetum cinerariifolium]
MTTLKYADTHNMVAFLSKPTKSDGFEKIVDFLNAHPIREVQIHARVDGKEIVITESFVRRDLQLVDEEGIDSLPNSTIFEQLALMSPKTTAWNELSTTMASAIICLATDQKFNFSKLIFDSMIRNLDNVSDEAVHMELGNRLVMGATIASSLEAEPDSVLRNHKGYFAQTRFERVSKHSNDSLLARGNTLRSDEDRLKFDELMALCTTLRNRVLDLEKTKTTQRNKIDSFKRRVKKLEKRNWSRTHNLKRLYKVGLIDRVEYSRDKESMGEDASKQGRRIDAIDADDKITMVNDVDNEIFDVDDLGGEEVFVVEQEENTA